MKVLTEADLRAARLSANTKEYHVSANVFVTPLAKEFLRDRGISLVIGSSSESSTQGEQEAAGKGKVSPNGSEKRHSSMTVTKLSSGSGKPMYIDAETGEEYETKPEEMTHLRGNLLVYKTHPRIVFRGRLDGLQARILLLQKKSYVSEAARRDLQDILDCVRQVLGAEVKGEKIADSLIFGLNEEQIHRMSHHVKEEFGIGHPIPDHTMSEFALELNLLRTEVRKAELAAAEAFPKKDDLGIIKVLNRLSSGVYIMFCREVVGRY